MATVVEIAQWGLVMLALFVNTIYLFALRYMHRKKHIDALYFLQMIKSFNVVFVVIFTAVWDVHLQNGLPATNSLCNSTDAFGVFLLDMYPVAHVIVALTRLRIVYCRGSSASLVTVPSTLRMTGLIMTSALFVFLGFVLAFQYTNRRSAKDSRCSDPHNTIYLAYEATDFLLYTLLPCICVPIVYFVIYKKLTNTVYRKSLIRTRRSSRIATTNMVNFTKMLVFVFFVTWLLYSVSRILFLFYTKDYALQIVQTFFKLLICIGHPLGEGVLQNGTFSRIAYMFKDLISRKRNSTAEIFEPNTNKNTNDQHDITIVTETCMPVSEETSLPIPGLELKSNTLFEWVTSV